MIKKIFGWALVLLTGVILTGRSAAMAMENETAVMHLREALVLGIENNLDIKITRTGVPISGLDVIIQKAVFDPILDATVFSSEIKSPIALATTPLSDVTTEQLGAVAGVTQTMPWGLTSRLSFETYRTEENAPSYLLAPEYRDYIVLDISQPLLRDFGTKINTTNIRVAQNRQKQAVLEYVSRVNAIVRAVETTYYDLANAVRVLELRIESRELASALLEGNRKKFEAGVVPVSEVQRAETAVAQRDELVLFAVQQAEIISDRLKDLLDIRWEGPLSDKMIAPEMARITDRTIPELSTALAAALNNRPELQQQVLEIENQDITIAFYDNRTLPRLDLSATLGLNGLSGDPRGTLPADTGFEGGFWDAFSGLTDGDGYEWRLGLSLTYPWGNRAAKSRYHRAELEKKRAVYQYKRIEGAFETDVKNAWTNVSRSLERIDVAERFESLAAVTLDQEMKRMEQGLSDTFRILQFQDDLIEAKIRKATAIIDYRKGLSDLYYSMGVILDRHDIEVHDPHRGDVS
ncbi:MAG: TolC family protein [Desulfobacterales bacterium]